MVSYLSDESLSTQYMDDISRMMSDGYSIGLNRVANLRRHLDSVCPGCAPKSAGPLATPYICSLGTFAGKNT